MYARLVLFTIGPGTRSIAEKLIDQQNAVLRAQKGFKGATFLADDASGQYGGLVLWESKKDAEAAFEALFLRLQEALKDKLKAPPITTLFEVFEPTA